MSAPTTQSSLFPAMEKFGIRVLEEFQPRRRSTACAALRGGVCHRACQGLDGDRSRLQRGREFGHFVAGDVDTEEAEAECRRPGVRVRSRTSLMPSSVLKKAIERRSMVHLVEVKRMYGVSLAAMIYRRRKGRVHQAAPNEASGSGPAAKRVGNSGSPRRVSPDRALRFGSCSSGRLSGRK